MSNNRMIEYQVNREITLDQFRQLLQKSTLGERRPIDDQDCLQGMISNSNLTITAWDQETLIGISRCMTDFHYACYLSDLAVNQSYQRQGIGKQLLQLTQNQLQAKCKLILIAAPNANDYYSPLGFTQSPRCWVLTPEI